MIDHEYKVKRYISIYSEETENLVEEVDFETFDLPSFQSEFEVDDIEDPMFDSFQINPNNIEFIEHYLGKSPNWDFQKFSYFVEAHSI